MFYKTYSLLTESGGLLPNFFAGGTAFLTVTFVDFDDEPLELKFETKRSAKFQNQNDENEDDTHLFFFPRLATLTTATGASSGERVDSWALMVCWT